MPTWVVGMVGEGRQSELSCVCVGKCMGECERVGGERTSEQGWLVSA